MEGWLKGVRGCRGVWSERTIIMYGLKECVELVVRERLNCMRNTHICTRPEPLRTSNCQRPLVDNPLVECAHIEYLRPTCGDEAFLPGHHRFSTPH